MSPLLPCHFLMMKSKVVLAPPGAFLSADVYCRKRWRQVQHLANEFWTRWRKAFLLSLQQLQKWVRPARNLCVGDIILIKDDNAMQSSWDLALVPSTIPSSNGVVCKVQLVLADA